MNINRCKEYCNKIDLKPSTMDTKTGLLLLAVFAGVLAVPTPEYDRKFFEDQGTRIVGGTQSPTGSRPYVVALSTGLLVRSFLCGGSLITPRSVLTAAHCIDAVYSRGSLTSTLRATVGTNRWNSGGTNYNLARNISHPNWVSSTYKNDLGILVTSSQVVLTNTVALVPITYDHIPGGVSSVVAGWGRIRNNGALSAALLEITLPTIEGERCVTDVADASVSFNIRAPAVEPHIELCVFHSANVGTCRGDSGSPLVRESDTQQIGIVSWGFPCARGAPDMFVRISGFKDWLESNIVY